jgi:hypothetical protein
MRRPSLPLMTSALAMPILLGCGEQPDITDQTHAAPTSAPAASVNLAGSSVSRFNDRPEL